MRARDAVVALLVILACLVAAGCGAGELGTQADLLAMGGIAASTADEVLVGARDRELDAIVERARVECEGGRCNADPDEDPETAAADAARGEAFRAELAAAEARWAPALACREPVVEALRGWGDGIEVAARASTPALGLGLVAARAGRFLSAYRALRRCVEAAAPDVDLPDLPVGIGGGGRGQ